MANVFASVLSFVSNIVNNEVSTFTIFGSWGEEECPKEML